ncbi:hypothetical protein R1flu_026664 [Riccia fluitans]|uniref:Protein kinase domain-containing protein n=1 Tax=Riccia fluitans TaxID=41844 RepID=A0ABD1XGL6_9MARC
MYRASGFEGTDSQSEDVDLAKKRSDRGIAERVEELSLTWEDLEMATDNFSDLQVLAADARYSRSFIALRQVFPFLMTVKVYNLSIPGARMAYETELQILRLCQHPNIVQLVGEMKNILILEGLAGGTLDSLLFNDLTRKITWDTRLKIALDVANGLAYLHHFTWTYKTRNRLPCKGIVHCNLSPSAVFLSGSTAKIGELCYSMLLHNTDEIEEGKVGGAFVYLSPECASRGIVSCKGDVYSFGATIVEMIVRKRISDIIQQLKEPWTWEADHLSDLIRQNFVTDSSLLPELDSNSYRESVSELARLALQCMNPDAENRPAMKDREETKTTWVSYPRGRRES